VVGGEVVILGGAVLVTEELEEVSGQYV